MNEKLVLVLLLPCNTELGMGRCESVDRSTGMEWWNDLINSPCYFFPEAVLGVCNGSASLQIYTSCVSVSR